MSEIDEAEAFLASLELPKEEVDLGGGHVFTVRGLSHGETARLTEERRAKKQSPLEHEHRIVQAALLKPRMTIRQVERWSQSGPAGGFARVSMAIFRLSGLAEGAGKSTVDGAGDAPGS